MLALCALPVIIWNSEHGWITLRHVAGNAGLASNWRPTLRFLGEFFFIEAALLNPVFFVGALWAMAVFWRCRPVRPLELYFFCMGGVVFLGHLAYSLHSRVLPNWIAPGVLPMYCLMMSYWERRWREGLGHVKGWLIGGLVFGLAAVILLHDTDIIGTIAGRRLPGDVDPLRRVRGYEQAAACVEGTRRKLEQEGKPVFIICDHYGITGLFTFYLPQARAALPTKPLVYYRTSQTPDNQFYFWPEYRYSDWRKGENAIYVTEPGSCKLANDWPWRWLTGREVRFAKVPPPVPAPRVLLKEFESVTDLGVQEIEVEGRVMKRVQLFECRNLR